MQCEERTHVERTCADAVVDIIITIEHVQVRDHDTLRRQQKPHWDTVPARASRARGEFLPNLEHRAIAASHEKTRSWLPPAQDFDGACTLYL